MRKLFFKTGFFKNIFLVFMVVSGVLVPKEAQAQTPPVQPIKLDESFRPPISEGVNKCRANLKDRERTLTAFFDLDISTLYSIIGAISALSTSTAWVPVLRETNNQEPPPVIIEGIIRESFVNYYDSPYAHESHDQNFYVQLDPVYSNLNSLYNAREYVEGYGSVQLLEVEWETRYFAKEFWPMIGDRVWVAGRYIWDCGHPPELHTEIHPPEAVASTRFSPSIVRKDPASHPSLTNKTFFYASNNSGFYERVGRPQSLVGRRYEFDIPLPPRPSPSAEPVLEELSSPDLKLGEVNFQHRFNLSSEPNTASMTITLDKPGTEGNYGRVFVAGWRESVPTLGFCQVKVTLEQITINNPHPIVNITPDSNYAIETAGPTPWQLWVRVADRWREVLRTGDGPGPSITNLTGPVTKGQVVSIRESTDVIIPQKGIDKKIYLPQNEPLTISTAGWKSGLEDLEFGKTVPQSLFHSLSRLAIPALRPFTRGSSILDSIISGLNSGQNSVIGWVNKSYTAADNYGLGQHRENSRTPITYPFLDERGGAHYEATEDFTLEYRIERELFWCTPVIDSFEPLSVREGDTLKLKGKYFEHVNPARNIVIFKAAGTGTVEAPAFKVEAPAAGSADPRWTLEVKVPPGVGSGPLQIKTPFGEFTTANNPFQYRVLNTLVKPEISGFEPKEGRVPVVVTIKGKFQSSSETPSAGSDIMYSAVGFQLGSTPLTLLSVSDTQIVALIPKGARSDYLRVGTAGGSFTTVDQFKVLPPSAGDPLKSGVSIKVNSGATGMGGEREMTLEKALRVADGTLTRALETRPLDTKCKPKYLPGDSLPYAEELVTGKEIMRDCAYLDDVSGKTITRSVPTGVFENAGENYRDSVSIGSDLTVTVTGPLPSINGDVLSVNGTIQGSGGASGLTLTGVDSSVNGSGKMSGFTEASIIVKNGNRVTVEGVSLVNNTGAGIVVNNSPLTNLDLPLVAGNGGPGILITGEKSAGTTVKARRASDASAKGNQRGIEISDGAWGITVEVGAVIGNTEEGILVKGGKGGNTFKLDYTLTSPERTKADAEVARNGAEGVAIIDSPNNRVLLDIWRGRSPGVIYQASIHDNKGDGIRISGVPSRSNVVVGVGGVTAQPSQSSQYFERSLVRSVVNNKGNGIRIDGGASFNFVRGIVAGGNGENGILITGKGTDMQIIDSNRLGGDPSQGLGNGRNGLAIMAGSKNNWAGRVANVIIGNNENGVLIAGPGTSHNSITFNGIGLEVVKLTSRPDLWGEFPNQKNGVLISDGATDNYIGSLSPTLPGIIRAECCADAGYGSNAIGGNKEAGVRIEGGEARGNLVSPVGLHTYDYGFRGSLSQVLIGNKVGIDIAGASENSIGPTDALARNFIVRNKEAGIRIDGGEDNIIVNNVVGVLSSMTEPFEPNFVFAKKAGNGIGIALYNKAVRNRIGGYRANERNFISGNEGAGILMSGVRTSGAEDDGANMVINNVIGVNAQETGFQPGPRLATFKGPFFFPNEVGVRLEKGTSGQVIGGSGPSGYNVISGNKVGIVVADKESTTNKILGNRIGTMESGHHVLNLVQSASNLPNTEDGIQIQGATNTEIIGNLVSSNRGYGAVIDRASGTAVRGNLIGTDISGFGTVKDFFPPLGNVRGGIHVKDSPNTVIGSPGPEGGNIIRGNGGHGIWITGPESRGVKVWSNTIGADVVVPEGNAGDGIRIDGGASNVLIGGKAAPGVEGLEAPNRLWQNQGEGISVTGVATLGNTISLNSITGNTGKGIVTSNLGNNQIPPPKFTQINTNGFVQATVDPSFVPDGSIVEFFSDNARQGRMFLNKATTRNGRVEATILLPPTGNLTATVTSATTGDTSEFASVVPIPPPPPASFLKVEPASALLKDRQVSVTEKGVGLIHLKLSTGITPTIVKSLKLAFTGNPDSSVTTNLSIWEDKNGNGRIDTDEKQIAQPGDLSISSTFLSFDKLNVVLPAAAMMNWLLVGDLTSQGLGQIIQVEVSNKEDISAGGKVPGGVFEVVGVFPIRGPQLQIVDSKAATTEKPATTPSASPRTGEDGQQGRPTGIFGRLAKALSSIWKFFTRER